MAVPVAWTARRAVEAVLADAETGFNAAFRDIASTYGAAPLEFDFGPASGMPGVRSVIRSFVRSTEDVGIANGDALKTLVLYTSQITNQRRAKFTAFSGLVTAHFDFHIGQRLDDGYDLDSIIHENTEPLSDAIVDAVFEVFRDDVARTFPTNVYGFGPVSCDKQPTNFWQWGVERILPFSLQVEVRI